MSMRREGKKGRPTKNPGPVVLKKLYIEEEKTAKEIAEIYGVSPKTVRGWLYRAPSADEVQG